MNILEKLTIWYQAIFLNEKLATCQKLILGKSFSFKSLFVSLFISCSITATVVSLEGDIASTVAIFILGFLCDYLALITTLYFIQAFEGKTFQLIATALLVSLSLAFVSLCGIMYITLDDFTVFELTIDTWHDSHFLFSLTPLIPITLYTLLLGLWMVFVTVLIILFFVFRVLFSKVIILVLLIVALLLSGVFWFYFPDKAHIDTVAKHTRIIVRIDGEQIKIVAVINNANASLKNLPDYLVNALIAMEDRRFYDHHGIDLRGIARAIIKRNGGGSTITQQLTKNMLLSSKRSYLRKVEEAMLALKLEWYYDKNEILEFYLNQIPFGKGAYGVETAAMKFFNKHARYLNLYESALLIGSVTQPERFNFLRNPKLAHKRAILVLDTMEKQGYVTVEEVNLAKQEGVKKGKKKWSNAAGYRYLLDWAQVRRQLNEYFGNGEGDLTVITTLVPNTQRYAELAVRRGLSRAASRHVSQGALLAMDKSCAIRAIVGGKDYGRSQYNRAIQAERQPGSAFKPFVYLAALMQGANPTDVIDDKPVNINGWQPRNIDRRYLGRITLAEALRRSRNVATVRLMEKIGQKRVVDLAKSLGITTTEQWRNEPGLALGTGEVRLIDMVCANAVFANGGYKVSPYGILGIRDKKGNLLFWRDEVSNGGRLVEYKFIASLNEMLSAVVSSRGTGKNAAFGKHNTAGKTGTTNDYRDAWFVGYSAHLVTGVWVGNDDPREFMSGVTGGSVPAKIFRNFMANTHQGLEVKALPIAHAETD